MAARRPRPGRSLIIFFLGLAIIYGLTALSQASPAEGEKAWRPALGLDLQGGTRITLTAEKAPSSENLEEARRIIDQRVNGSGVAEAEVTTQGGKSIVVEVPGDGGNREELEQTVKRQAQLRFRLVACSDALSQRHPCCPWRQPTWLHDERADHGARHRWGARGLCRAQAHQLHGCAR